MPAAASDLLNGRLRHDILAPVWSDTLSAQAKGNQLIERLEAAALSTPHIEARIRRILGRDLPTTRQAALIGEILDEVASRVGSSS